MRLPLVPRKSNAMKTSISLTMLLAALGATALLGGCRGDREDAPPRQFFPDLDDQLKWKPQSASEFYADGRTMRPSAANTVAFGRNSFVPAADGPDWNAPYLEERERLLRNDPAKYEGRDGAGKMVVKIPVPVNAAMIQTGQTKYNIYCAACHGYLGDGQGQVGVQWASPVANFHEDTFKTQTADNLERWTPGHIFSVGMLGLYDAQNVQRMPGYAHALSADDAWAVVAYIRALQASRETSIESVPAEQRPALERLRADALRAATPASATPAQAAPGTGGNK